MIIKHIVPKFHIHAKTVCNVATGARVKAAI